MGTHPNRRAILQSLPAAAIGLSGCSAPSASGANGGPRGDPGWPMFQRDVRNTGCFRGDEQPSLYPTLSWTYETDGAVWGSPVAGDGLVYVGSYDHHMYALDSDTGERAWRFATGDRVDGTAAVHDGVVYFGSFDGSVYALDASTGEQQWELETHGIVRSSPTIVDDTIYVGGNCQHTECDYYYDDPEHEHGHVYAIDTESGDVHWEIEIEDGTMSTPAFDDGTVYIGCGDARIYAVDAETGDEEWVFEADDLVMSSPTLADGSLFVGSNDGNVYAIDAATGDEEWSFDTDGQYVSSSPSIRDDTVYVGSSGVPVGEIGQRALYGVVYALSAGTGEERWRHVTDAQEVGSTPAVVENAVYVGSHSQNERYAALHGLRLNGQERWTHEVDGVGIGSSPAVAGETLYVGAANGKVYAFT